MIFIDEYPGCVMCEVGIALWHVFIPPDWVVEKPGVPSGYFVNLLLVSEGSDQGAAVPMWWFHIKQWQHRLRALRDKPFG
ncbi:hypothetical protein, partial [Marinobacter xestospongiae]|uniref:hypothetical protein n=1 Tax=Marinobacter xestospongiae TaxID=994319 RepID=UPI002004E3F4